MQGQLYLFVCVGTDLNVFYPGSMYLGKFSSSHTIALSIESFNMKPRDFFFPFSVNHFSCHHDRNA